MAAVVKKQNAGAEGCSAAMEEWKRNSKVTELEEKNDSGGMVLWD